jgi:peptidoglycan biosynthesis protein MviN/MurJ (putative lipid II flippase)
VSVAGFLFARGDARTALRGAILHTFAVLVLALPLLPVIGVTALGIGTFVSSIVEGVVLGTQASRVHGIAIVRPLVAPTLAAVVAAVAGWFVAVAFASDVIGLFAGGAVALAIFVAALGALSPGALRETLQMATRSVRAAAA